MTGYEFAESLKLSAKFDNWEDTRNFAFNRDRECQLTACLTPEELKIVRQENGYQMMSSILDPCHILDKSTHKEYQYCPENIVIINRYFHTLLTEHRHPITKEFLNSRNDVLDWYFRAKFSKEETMFHEVHPDEYWLIYQQGKAVGEIKKISNKYCLYFNGVQIGCSDGFEYVQNIYMEYLRNLN